MEEPKIPTPAKGNLCLLCCFSFGNNDTPLTPTPARKNPKTSSVEQDVIEELINQISPPRSSPSTTITEPEPEPSESTNISTTDNNKDKDPLSSDSNNGTAAAEGPPSPEVFDVEDSVNCVTAFENPDIKRFCGEIELLSKESLNLTQTQQNFSTEVFLNSLEYFNKLTVCPECLKVVVRVTEARIKAKEREETVRVLQAKLLNELKELKKQVNEFHHEMLCIESVITSSDVSCLENFLEEFIPRPRSLEVDQDMVEAKGMIHKASVILFRNNILAVINDLQSFQREITTKLSCTLEPEPSRRGKLTGVKKKKYPKKKIKKRSKSLVNAEGFPGVINPSELVEIKTELSELVENSSNEDPLNTEDTIVSGRNPRSGYELRDKVFVLPDHFLHGPSIEGVPEENENEALFEDNLEEDVDFEMEMGDDGLPSSGSESSSEESLVFNDEDDDIVKPPPVKSPRKSRKRKSRGTSTGGGSGQDQPKNKKKKWKKKKKEVAIPDSVNLEKLSEFRRRIIARVYWRLEKHKQSKVTKQPASSSASMLDPTIDPRKGYIMEYNPIRKCLFIEDVEVKFNDDEEVLQCTKCQFRTQQTSTHHRSADTLMFHHILGKHLEIYKCGECLTVLGSLKRWQDHIRGHQKAFVCDICGKPMYSQESLYNHRWSHMNEQEMLEAIANGMRDPREKLQKMKERGALRSHVCLVCGRGFQTRFLLRSHEQIHREDRERIQCTLCGKTFLPMGFYSHQKYTCRPEGAPVLYHPCHLCPDKVFKSKHLLKRHHNRTHAATAEDRPHICELCGRGFKTRGELGRHGNAHLETRPWPCGKGCGAAFKHKKNCQRHEGNCTGAGTTRGKHTANSSPHKSILML